MYVCFFDVVNVCVCVVWIVFVCDVLCEKRLVCVRCFVVDGVVVMLCVVYVWLFVVCVVKGVDVCVLFGLFVGVCVLFECDDVLFVGWLYFLVFDARVADWLIDEERARGVL